MEHGTLSADVSVARTRAVWSVRSATVVWLVLNRGLDQKGGETNMISAYVIACQHGFPYLRGEAKVIEGKVYTRHTQKNSGKGGCLYVHVSATETHILKGETIDDPETDHRN